MRSLVCEEPGVWAWREDNFPTPADGEVLINIKRIGVCGTDLHAFAGNQAFFSYPRILGHELSGVVEDGNGTGFEKGQNVLVIPYIACGNCMACDNNRPNCCTNISVVGVHEDGGMRSHMTVPKQNVLAVDGLPLDSMALVECLAVGAHSVNRGQIKEGEDVVVVGAGPIGISCLQFAKARGGRVIMIDISDSRLNFCKESFGVDIVKAGPDAEAKVAELTNGRMAAAVIDATGNPNAMSGTVNFCGHTARVIFVGLTTKEISFTHSEIHKRELTLYCSRNALMEDFQWVVDSLKDGSVVTSCMVTHRTSLGDVPDVFNSWTQPETGVIKAIVEL